MDSYIIWDPKLCSEESSILAEIEVLKSQYLILVWLQKDSNSVKLTIRMIIKIIKMRIGVIDQYKG